MRKTESIQGSQLYSGLEPSPLFSALQGDQSPISGFTCWFNNYGGGYSGLGVSFSSEGITSVGGDLIDVNYAGGKPASWVVNWVGVSSGGPGTFTLNIDIVGTVTGFFTIPNHNCGVILSGGNDIIYGTIGYHEVASFPPLFNNPKAVVLKPAATTILVDGASGTNYVVAGNFVTVFWIGKTPADLPSANFKPTDYGLVQTPTQFFIPQP